MDPKGFIDGFVPNVVNELGNTSYQFGCIVGQNMAPLRYFCIAIMVIYHTS